MLKIATELGANVQDDNGTTYTLPADWQYDPNEKIASPIKKKQVVVLLIIPDLSFTDAVLREVSLTDAQIGALRQRDVVG